LLLDRRTNKADGSPTSENATKIDHEQNMGFVDIDHKHPTIGLVIS
jgi:hypothetical protein